MEIATNKKPMFRAPNNRVQGQLTLGTPTQASGESHTPLQIGGNINNFLEVYTVNRNNGDTASTDFVAGNDSDDASIASHYIDMGINSSGFSGTTTATGIVKSVSVNAGGTGYTVGDILTLSSGDGTARVTVLTLTGSAVATVSLTENGSGYTVASSNTTGGTGTSCTINVVSLFDLTAYVANGGYMVVSGGELLIGTDDTVANKTIRFITNGQATANERARITNTGLTVMPVTAVPAGGTAATGLMFSSTANLGVFFGSGVPTLTAAKGSLYLRTDGTTTNDRMYVNTSGTTTWTAVTTVA
jgi:hypothetical protein